MQLDAVDFLDLTHYYRLSVVTDPEAQDQLNNAMSGGLLTTQERPPMMTEAAKKITPPTWWKGGTTISDATMVVENLRKGRTS